MSGGDQTISDWLHMCGRAEMLLCSRPETEQKQKQGIGFYYLPDTLGGGISHEISSGMQIVLFFFFQVEQLISDFFFPFLTNSCLFSAPVYSPGRVEVSLHKLGTLTKMDACFYVPQRRRFSLLILSGPLGKHTVYISAHRRDGCSQFSDTESPSHSKLFI